MDRQDCVARPLLSDIIASHPFVGTSLILRRSGRLLYGLRPPRMEGTRKIVELTGIGGRGAGILPEAGIPTVSSKALAHLNELSRNVPAPLLGSLLVRRTN